MRLSRVRQEGVADGNIIENEELNKILDIKDCRHPLNSDNQVQILIKISKIENNF